MSEWTIVASCSPLYQWHLAVALPYLYTHVHTNIPSLSTQMLKSQCWSKLIPFD